MGYWLGIAFSCLDVLCVAVFCDAFLERKTRGLRFVVGVLLYGVLSYIATVFVSHISEESPITLLKFAALITVYFVLHPCFIPGNSGCGCWWLFWRMQFPPCWNFAFFILCWHCFIFVMMNMWRI